MAPISAALSDLARSNLLGEVAHGLLLDDAMRRKWPRNAAQGIRANLPRSSLKANA